MSTHPPPIDNCTEPAQRDDSSAAGAAIETPLDAVGHAADALKRLDELAEENAALGRDLLRCYEQLSLVFEITEHIAFLHDPQHVREALLRRYAAMLEAGAILVDEGGRITRVPLPGGGGPEINVDPWIIAQGLSEEIAAVRKSNRAHVSSSTSSGDAAPSFHILLGALRQFDAESAVIITIRSGDQQPFYSGDMMASESSLGYGGHILSNMLMVGHLQKMAFETVCALVSAIDQKDHYTSGHAQRVGWLATLTGRQLGLAEPELQRLEWAGLLHDVGKIGVSETILNKPGKLTDEEMAGMKRHPRMSYDVLKPVASLESILGAVLHHHENHDGSGYPEGLSGDQIPLAARIVHVVDIFDALTSTRSYRHGFTRERAFAILKEEAGRVTNPEVTRAFLEAFEKYMHEQPDDFQTRFAHIATGAPDDSA